MTQDSTFDQKRHFYGAILGPLIAALIWFSPIDGLNDAQHHLLSIMSLVAIWWITEPVAIPVTSLLGPTLCVLVGVVPMKEAFVTHGDRPPSVRLQGDCSAVFFNEFQNHPHILTFSLGMPLYKGAEAR